MKKPKLSLYHQDKDNDKDKDNDNDNHNHINNLTDNSMTATKTLEMNSCFDLED